MPFNVKEENAALGLKYTVSALSHANLRACTHFITRPFESSSRGPVRYIKRCFIRSRFMEIKLQDSRYSRLNVVRNKRGKFR